MKYGQMYKGKRELYDGLGTAELDAVEVLLRIVVRKLFELGVSADDVVRSSRAAVARTIKEEAAARGESCEVAAKRHAWSSKTVHRNSNPENTHRLRRRLQLATHVCLSEQLMGSGQRATVSEAEAIVRDSCWFALLQRSKRPDGGYHNPYDDILVPLVRTGMLRYDGDGRFTPIQNQQTDCAHLEKYLNSVETHCEAFAGTLFASARSVTSRRMCRY